MKVQNQKSSNYKDEIQKKNILQGVKSEMSYITEGKTLLTQKKNVGVRLYRL